MIKKLDVLNIWGKKKIELKGKNISFKYSSNDKYILKDIDFSIDNSKIMGLVGDSGSGKSALCKILSGYINNFEGEVTLNGKHLLKKEFCPVQLIFQHPEKVMNPKWKMQEVLSESWNVDESLLNEFGI